MAKIDDVIHGLREYRKSCAKKTPVGKRQLIDGVECILHIPENESKNRALFIFFHGGAWIGGDAVIVDSFCKTVSEGAGCVAVNINYTKLDVQPFPYPLEQAMNVIGYFIKHRDEYGISADKIVVGGCSAGGHLAAATAMTAKQRGVTLARQIPIYPFTEWTGLIKNPLNDFGLEGVAIEEWEKLFFAKMPKSDICLSPAAASDKELLGIAAADIIVCGDDCLKEQGTFYYERLKKAGVPATLKEYEKAMHGFLEVNREDFDGENPAINSEQAAMARDCEKYIIDIVKGL